MSQAEKFRKLSTLIGSRAVSLFLAGCWISISFWATNALTVRAPASVLLVGAVIGLLTTFVYLLIARFVSEQTKRRSFGVLVAATIIFNTYGIVFELTFQALYQSYYLSGKISLVIWAVLLIGIAIAAWFTITDETKVTALKGAVWVLLVFACAEGIWRAVPVIGSPNSALSDQQRNRPDATKSAENNEVLPNIYYILMDGYARPDQLKKRLRLNIDNFLADLSGMGFKIPELTRSNYLTTNLSLGHTLLGDYYVIDDKTHEKFILGDGPSSAAEEGFSPVISKFRSKGYAFQRLGACNGQEDRCLSPYSALPPDVVELLHNTPTVIALRYINPELVKVNLHDMSLPGLFEELLKFDNEQVFTFAHVLYPHDTVYNEDCSRIEADFERSMAARTLNDRMLKDKTAYRKTVVCVNRQLAHGLQLLLADKRPKIVVLASDHGTAFAAPGDLPAADWPDDAIIERSAIFNAWLLPARCQNYLYDGITPINHFELIFACLDGKPPKFRPDETYAVFYGDKRVKRVPESIFQTP